jgi:isopenicillin N synthase-like dioxygenase
MNPATLPVIDIEPFLANGNEAKKRPIAEQLHEACRTYGAFYLKGHGINNKAVLGNMKSFFALSEPQKNAIAIREGGFTRGYIGMGEESGSDALEVKEAFSYGYSWEKGRTPENSMQGENVWPTAESLTDGWQHSMEEFYAQMIRVAEGLTRAFSLSYGMEENHLAAFCTSGDTISLMRLFHYFPYQTADKKFPRQHDRIGSSPHTDWGFLTLILQEDGVTGLQLHKDGAWFDVPPVPDTLMVNCGDYFSLLTSGEYISPLHRVVSEGKERMSGVLFYYPSYDAKIPLLGNQTYSLFTNQLEDGGVVDASSITEKPFGQYIREKWEQVQRLDKH